MRNLLIIIGCMLLMPLMALAQTASSPVNRDAEIRSVVTAYVQQKTAGLGCEARIKRLAINGKPALPEGALEYEVSAPRQWEGWGGATISVLVRQKDRVVGNIPVRVEVEALAEMVVTARQINHGSIISTDDLALRKQDLALVRGRYLGRLEEAVGKKARVALRANAAIKPEQLEKAPLIKSGQLLTIVAENERMRITVTGKAKNAGAEGDTITVQNMSSMKEMPARVLDAGTVLVVF